MRQPLLRRPLLALAGVSLVVSAITMLVIPLAVGWDRFQALLDGAWAMDVHFRDAPLEANLPVLLALTGVWHVNGLGLNARAVLCYDDRLKRFQAFLQQLEMESNGKRVDHDGRSVAYHTAPVVFGAEGTVGQHSFHQLLHQGTHRVAADFVVPYESPSGKVEDSVLTLSNALAQANVLARGRSLEDVLSDPKVRAGGEKAAALAPHRVHPGGRPSSTVQRSELSTRPSTRIRYPRIPCWPGGSPVVIEVSALAVVDGATVVTALPVSAASSGSSALADRLMRDSPIPSRSFAPAMPNRSSRSMARNICPTVLRSCGPTEAGPAISRSMRPPCPRRIFINAVGTCARRSRACRGRSDSSPTRLRATPERFSSPGVGKISSASLRPSPCWMY